MGMYTPNARVLAPNSKMASSSAAVRAEFGAMIDADLGGELTSVEATVSGDVGYNVGTFTLHADGTMVDSGKFIETWSRGSDGVWRISNDIYNSDMPLPEPGSGTYIMISHEVESAERWMAAWRGENNRHMLFKENGADHVHTFVRPENPHLTGLVVKVNDMGALEAMLATEDGMAAAAEDGVRADTIKVLTQSR
jgi:ketosteroid isomerase-like protein